MAIVLATDGGSTMFRNLFAALAACLMLPIVAIPSSAQQPARAPTLGDKLQPYIGCINRLSSRTFDSEARYKSWVGKTGPTGKERIIYGLYTIYDTKDCRERVERIATTPPAVPELEKAGADYVAAVTAIEPMLKEANDYYDQKNYLDDKMAKGREMHPRLISAWENFGKADKTLREVVQRLNDQVQDEQIADIEKREGRKMRWHVLTLMSKAKALQRVEGGDQSKIDLAKVTPALEAYEASVIALEKYAEANPGEKVGSFYISAAKSYLASAKALMRRVRDKVPYSQGDRMILGGPGGGGGGWMVEGSPPRLLKDYNGLIDAYNRGPTI